MGEDRTDEPQPTSRRLLVGDAAVALGISEGAVRMRVKRGTLASTREGRRMYVLLDPDPTSDPGRTHDQSHDRTNELISTLREQLDAERQAHAEARRLLAAALERIPAIEAPETGRDASESAEPRPATEEAQAPSEGSQGRPWWRRLVGG